MSCTIANISALADYFAIFGLRLSVTLMRKMLETAYFEALQKKKISYEEYSRVSVLAC
jgi:hypothetical protein